MSGDSGFALDVVACALLAILLWGACAGIGNRLLPQMRAAPTPDEPVGWHQPGVAACVGLSVLVMLGGICVLLHIPWWLSVVPFLVGGLVLAIRDVRAFDFRGVPKPLRVLGGLAAAALLLVALIEAIPGLRFPPNVCDDLRAYLPLARRLVDTNGLVDAWSARRLQNLGGFVYLQSLAVSVFGFAGIGVIETVVASIFLGGMFVANGLRVTWVRALSVVLILAIPLLWVPRVNTTGVLMGSPLFIALLAATVELSKALRAGDRSAAYRWAVAAGLVTATLTSVRPPMGVLAGLIIALGALVDRGPALLARGRTVAVAGVSALVAIAPWSIALWQTSGTPLYPLLSGNQNLEAVQGLPERSLFGVAKEAGGLLLAGPYLGVAVGVLLIAILARRFLPDARLVALAAAATCAVVILFAVNESFAPKQAFVRYIAPMSGGLSIFLVCETLRGADARLRARMPRPLWALAAAVSAALVVAALGFSSLGVSLESPPLPSGATLVSRAMGNELLTDVPGLEVTTEALTRDYRRALRTVDPDTTISAVDRAYLINFSKYDIPNMDLPGLTAPDGKFPFFAGTGAKIARLRDAGYDTLLVTVPDRDACLRPFQLSVQQAARDGSHSYFARYYLDWDASIIAIARSAPDAIKEYGSLIVIDLPAAQHVFPTGDVSS